jgi:hypothetical protein
MSESMLAARPVDADRFGRLAEKWKSERGPTSSITQMAMHPAYQEIIGMGLAAIPFLLRELEQAPDHWFWALKSITGIDPVPEEDRGNLTLMTRDWLTWARKQGYEW